MTFHVKRSGQELQLLTAPATDQMFRGEFIDPKIPGYQTSYDEISVGKALIGRLRSTIESEPRQTNATCQDGPMMPARRCFPAVLTRAFNAI